MSNVVRILPKKSPMYKWITTARYIMTKHGASKVRTWIEINVPEQLRAAVTTQLVKRT